MTFYKKAIVSILLVSLLIAAIFSTWIYSQINGALPILDGTSTIFGLTHNVTIERDAQGIPTIKAKTRTDLAIATGFIHAQERFFQMDLLRRNAAGELSSLFGKAALNYDKSIRIHRFRQRAEHIVNQLPPDQLALLKAYTKGVNEGLRTLQTQPFEYLLLQQNPVEWRAQDTVLTVLSMYLDLQYKDGKRERTLGLIKSTFSDDIYAFLNPKGSRWDAAIDGSQFPPAPLPTELWKNTQTLSEQFEEQPPTNYNGEEFPGSNNWAVSGAITKTGHAIIANDMHLGLRVPNTWFRASFEYQSNSKESIKITGLTLPGTPAMVTGSNGKIAWGFTNSYGDWSDVITLVTNNDNTQYLTPDGYKQFTEYRQVIAIKDEQPHEFITKETIWGPVIGENSRGKMLAYRWVAHDVQAVNFVAQQLEQANNVEQAINIANRSGIPAQNMMVGDKNGNIGWTIMGPIPIKSGNFGETPSDWSNGTNAWKGYLSASNYPKVVNPKDHRLWTANARVVGGEMLNKLGNGGYALGARAQQIKEDLFSKSLFNEQSLLDIALDDRALFLKRWKTFILTKILTDKTISQYPTWQEAKSLLAQPNLRASVNSIAYRITRNFRINLRDEVFKPLVEQLSPLDKGFDFYTIRHQIETPLWELINQQPDKLLTKQQGSWNDTFIRAFTKTINDMTIEQPLSQATWGQQNTTNIAHPLTKGVPLLSHWLNMPHTSLAGDSYMPRVQGKSFGASERMVVSPGQEESGILTMPTSQAGHPWSPYYGKGHQDWEQGRASPFLPGKTQYSLTLLNY